MDAAVKFFAEYTTVDLFAVLTMLIVCVRGIESFIKWIAGKLKAYYNLQRGIEDKEDTIDIHTAEIKALTERIDSFVATVDQQYTAIMEKVDAQQERLEQLDEEGKQRDIALLRDRISGGMRYYSKNKDEHGNVHISLSDYENMESLFQEYFKAGRNGTFKQMYENEFQKFIIDK